MEIRVVILYAGWKGDMDNRPCAWGIPYEGPLPKETSNRIC